MANEVKYQNQIWGEPIAGERLSTNGHYTGEHLGTPIQDAKNEASVMAFDEVRGQIYSQLFAQKQNEAYEAKVAELKEKFVK